MNYFDTAAGQNTMENISRQLTRIADSLEALAAAWGKTPEENRRRRGLSQNCRRDGILKGKERPVVLTDLFLFAKISKWAKEPWLIVAE